MTDVSWLGPAIDVRPLIGPQQAAFVAMLRDLDEQDWSRPTICPGWDVKDVTAHVLGGHLGLLSRHRDDFRAPQPHAGEEFTHFLDRINDEWVVAARRMSPRVLVDQLAVAADQVVAFWPTVDMDAVTSSVSWASAEPVPVWLDVAREFSEYWAHQQQICEATGRGGLADPAYLRPLIDTFMRALPHTLRDTHAPEGAILRVVVTGPGKGTWHCTRSAARWRLDRLADDQPAARPAARLELDTDTAWRLCTRGITPGQAAARASVEGDSVLAAAALQILAIIWSAEASG
jgi:uncharacterized protein (TIGR03083 family)